MNLLDGFNSFLSMCGIPDEKTIKDSKESFNDVFSRFSYLLGISRLMGMLVGLGRRNDFIVVDGKVKKCWCGKDLVESPVFSHVSSDLRLMICPERKVVKGVKYKVNFHLFVFEEKEKCDIT